MRVLGLHGVYPRSHDASACLIDGDQLVALVEEERFTRSKRAFDQMPSNAANYCLEQAGIEINGIDVITVGWQGELLAAQDVLPKNLQSGLDKEIPIKQIEHHQAHAASVFYTSPFEEAAILVVDGQGESESTTIWRGTPQGLEKIVAYDVNSSLGYLYGAVSKYCGLGSFGAGKVMGLAPYGSPIYATLLKEIYRSIKLPDQVGHDSQDQYFDQFLNRLYKSGIPKTEVTVVIDPITLKQRTEPVLSEVQNNIAASVQVVLEQELLVLAKRAHELTGLDYLCMAGGVAMNCVSNSIIQNSGIFKDVFVQPGCEDSGVALGSALAFTKQKVPLTNVYTGPSFTDDQIAEQLQKLGIRFTRHHDIAQQTATLLAERNIIGWVQGGLEYGPRALGGRSILAHPGSVEMRDRVNQIKSREPWRPFGPSVLAERSAELFYDAHESMYMLRSFLVNEEWRERMAAVVHVDGSTRPQTVTREQAPRYYDMISEFARLTGTPGVLNTSFNNYDEPIVATPLDAVRTFFSTGLGALVLGNNLILK